MNDLVREGRIQVPVFGEHELLDRILRGERIYSCCRGRPAWRTQSASSSL
jgi:hypothetical protein